MVKKMKTFDYCYLGTDVLINKLGIKDSIELEKMEDKLTFIKGLAIVNDSPVKGTLNFDHLKKMNKFLFGDLYEWAGQERNVNIGKGFTFCEVRNIPEFSNDIFSKLKKANYFLGESKEKLIEGCTALYDDLNCLHPFREGNGRTNKIFLQYVSGINGYNFNFDMIPKDYWNKASYAASMGTDVYLKGALSDCIVEISEEKSGIYRSACGLKTLEEKITFSKEDLVTEVLAFVRDKEDKNEIVNKEFMFGPNKFKVVDLQKEQGLNRAEAIIENCETHELFLEKNFAGSNPFKLDLKQKTNSRTLEMGKSLKQKIM